MKKHNPVTMRQRVLRAAFKHAVKLVNTGKYIMPGGVRVMADGSMRVKLVRVK